MGKNFSRNQKRENRNEDDFYQTPHCLASTFLQKVFKENIFEINSRNDVLVADFCCGKSAIGQVIRNYPDKFSVLFESDLKTGRDFLKTPTTELKEHCCEGKESLGIMNPPFRLFNNWVEKCFEVFDIGFALLAPTTYLQGVHRFNRNGTGIFQNKDYPLTHVLTFNRYPMLSTELREDSKIEIGVQALSWFVFQKGKPNTTVHDWLDIDEYVLRKR